MHIPSDETMRVLNAFEEAAKEWGHVRTIPIYVEGTPEELRNVSSLNAYSRTRNKLLEYLWKLEEPRREQHHFVQTALDIFGDTPENPAADTKKVLEKIRDAAQKVLDGLEQ